MRLSPAATFATLMGLLSIAASAADMDVVTLNDGRTVEGQIVREDEVAVFLKLANGEERGIAKGRIAKVDRGAKVAPTAPVPAGPEGAAVPMVPPEPADPKGEAQELFQELKDLGHSSRDKRKAAIERAKQLGFKAVPVLLAISHPKQKCTSELRIGALRALAELGPLDQQGALTLGWIALRDADHEVRREACRTIRLLKEDRALIYILQFSCNPDRATQFAAARALREINNDRAFASLAGAIPQPTVNGNFGEPDARSRSIELPVGPGGAKMPIFLPSREITGTAENISSPPADALKMIAGKELGSLPGVWINWLNEKVGLITEEEREESRRKRSLINKMGNPQAESSGP